MANISKLRPVIDRLSVDHPSLDIIDAVISHMREIGIPNGAIALYLSERAASLRAHDVDPRSIEPSATAYGDLGYPEVSRS